MYSRNGGYPSVVLYCRADRRVVGEYLRSGLGQLLGREKTWIRQPTGKRDNLRPLSVTFRISRMKDFGIDPHSGCVQGIHSSPPL